MSISMASRAEVPLLVAFADLTGYAVQCQRVDDDALAAVMDGYYQLVAACVAAAGGRTVKFMGDAALVVFDEAQVDAGVGALLDLKEKADHYFGAAGWDCRVHVKAHFGHVIAGPYGPAGDERFDVLGRNVNTAAMLDATGVSLSTEAFRRLSPDMRRRFKKHTWPVTYIRIEDPHRFRRR
jgi:class 3 adenylate cyclase